jgi:hypothetical protein
VLGVAFAGGGLSFTGTAGGTAQVAGDSFTITVAPGSGKYVPYDPTAATGREFACAILYGGRDATSADKKCTVNDRGPMRVNAGELVWGANVTTNQHKLNALAALLALAGRRHPGDLTPAAALRRGFPRQPNPGPEAPATARSFSHDHWHGRLPPGRLLDVDPHLDHRARPVPAQMLGDLNIFTPNPIRTTALAVEERDGVLTGLIQTSQRGGADQHRASPRSARSATSRRRASTHGDTITAAEVQGIRAFGEETEFMQLQAEVARRLAGPTGLLSNLAYTHENMRLGADAGHPGRCRRLDPLQLVRRVRDRCAGRGGVQPGRRRGQLAALADQRQVRDMARASKGALLASSRVSRPLRRQLL